MVTFSVDTHLFRELGELLVGRDSTALIELIKNSYDADATQVIVYGESLSNPGRGYIRIRDNGVGMSREDFQKGFLTIASRAKDDDRRRSKVFQRRYTGQKGVGRLAAHKIARLLELQSSSWSGRELKTDKVALPSSGKLLEVVIDWDKVEQKETLDQVAKTNAITIDASAPSGESAGTTITLRNLRHKWTRAEHSRFMSELQAFQPPQALTDPLPPSVCDHPLFEKPRVRDIAAKAGTQFSVILDGELSPPDEYWRAIVEAANWVIEIDATRSDGVKFRIAPTSSTAEKLDNAVSRDFILPHPSPKHGPFFQARILKRTGALKGDSETKTWAGKSSGVRVYMEGFRVLPYGESGDDWLRLDADTAERGRWTTIDSELEDQLRRGEREPSAGLSHLPNKHYFGAVFLTERHGPGLRMLVNREGFVPNQSFYSLQEIVRTGIDLSTRVQTAATEKTRAEHRAQRRGPADEANKYVSATEINERNVSEAKALAINARRLISSGDVASANQVIKSAISQIEDIEHRAEDASHERAIYRVVASVGTQVASFVHEINAILDMAQAVESALKRILNSKDHLPGGIRKQLAALQRDTGEMRRAVERQASYLIDVISPDSRRRRGRQSLADKFATGVKLVESTAAREHVKIINKIPADVKSPPMFAAELTTVFSNLLSNAVKAAGPKGVIRATAKTRSGGKTILRVENTGASVKVKDRERFFQPFESTTAKVDTALGQGMGLGLTLTRAMLEEYGASISFVEPTSGFATAVEIIFPE